MAEPLETLTFKLRLDFREYFGIICKIILLTGSCEA